MFYFLTEATSGQLLIPELALKSTPNRKSWPALPQRPSPTLHTQGVRRLLRDTLKNAGSPGVAATMVGGVLGGGGPKCFAVFY